MKKLFFLLSAISYLLFPRMVCAQSVSLAVNPPVVEILLSPNKKVTQTFNFEYSGEDLVATPEIHVVSPMDSTGHVSIDPNPVNLSTIPLSVISDHQLNKPFVLSGTSVPLTLTFEAASSDTTQDVYLALVFKVSSGDPLTKQNQATPAISALILTTITPSGVLPINLEIKDFNLPLVHDSWTPLSVSPSLSNNTPIMIRPLGTLAVISPTDKSSFSMPLYPNLILGNSTRLIQGSDQVPNPLPLTWQPKWSNIGPYRIHLTITSQGNTKLTEIEKVVWVIPIRIIFVTLFCLTLIIIFVRKFGRKPVIDTQI